MAQDQTYNDDTPRGFTLEEEERILQRRYRLGRAHKRSSRRGEDGKGSLNINSMMDLMTIILVFLLMSSKQQLVQPEMSDELFMPWSSSSLLVEDSMTITITAQAVLVNNEFVVEVDNGDIPENRRVSSTSPLIPDLQEAVERVIHVEERWDVVRQEATENVATVIADHETPYQVITYVMMTASAGGVQKFRFAVLNKTPEGLWDEG